MKLIHRRSAVAFLATLLIGASSTILQDDESPATASPVGIADALFASLTNPVGSMQVDTVVTASNQLYDADGKAVRVIATSTTCRLGQVVVQQSHGIHTLPVSSSTGLTVRVGPFNTGLGNMLAAEAMGELDPAILKSYHAAGSHVPAHDITVSPAASKTWGTASSADDVMASVVLVDDA